MWKVSINYKAWIQKCHLILSCSTAAVQETHYWTIVLGQQRQQLKNWQRMLQIKGQAITVSLRWRNKATYRRAKVSDYKMRVSSLNVLENTALFYGIMNTHWTWGRQPKRSKQRHREMGSCEGNHRFERSPGRERTTNKQESKGRM